MVVLFGRVWLVGGSGGFQVCGLLWVFGCFWFGRFLVGLQVSIQPVFFGCFFVVVVVVVVIF